MTAPFQFLSAYDDSTTLPAGVAGYSLSIACDGDTSDVALRQRAETGLTSPVLTGDVECSASQVVDYTATRDGTTGGATAFVHGYYE